MARSGEVTSIVFAVQHADLGTSYGSSGGVSRQLIGCIAVIQADMIRITLEAP